MLFIVGKIKWIMLVSGALTCTMIYAAIAPQAALQGMFGETLQGPLAEIVVRNWGVLITAIGAMLIYGAYHTESRTPVLAVAALTKLTFIALVLAQGSRYLNQQAGIAVAIDAVWVVLYACYLVAPREKK